ncbi:serine/threonine-protein kinase [Kitasatospora sp. NPDC059146]|uniref:serine/threonine-protein kinase n=1 Tax=unclassified Kitasatospora TaxID=2633591 RepID=UPI0036C71856
MLPGTLLNNRYRILRELGQGGEGELFVARDEYDRRDVAVKAQFRRFGQSLTEYAELAEPLGDELDRLRFMESVPGIPRVLDDGWHSGWGERRYIVMELIDGSTLRSWMGRHQPVLATDAACVVAQLCDTLALVHAHYVHRDVTPNNAMIQPDGRIRLLDVGNSTDYGTRNYDPRGTPKYAAPEQYVLNSEPTAKSDVFALGALLFEMMTSELPYGSVDGPPRGTEPAFPNGLDAHMPEKLRSLGLAMVAVDPRERPSVSEVRGYLRPWLPAFDSSRGPKAPRPDPSTYFRLVEPGR